MFTGKKAIDVTRKLTQGMTVWPGDEGVAFKRVSSIDEGAVCNVTMIVMSVHSGTHMDAPLHFLPDKPAIIDVPVELLFGKVLLIEAKEYSIEEGLLSQINLEPFQAVFFKTRSSETNEMTPFTTPYPALTQGSAEYLVNQGIKVVGIDYLSVEYCTDNQFPVHRILLGNNVWVIENMTFKGVEPGAYDYVSMPLKLEGSDGSPARVLLFKDS